MIALIIIGGILLLLLLLILSPVKFEIQFSGEFYLKVKYLFLTFPLLPGKETDEKTGEEMPEEDNDQISNMSKKIRAILKEKGFKGFMKSLFDLLKLLKDSSQRLLSRVKLKRFDLYLCVGGACDAAEAAIHYGEISAVVYSAVGALFSLLPCKKKAVSVDLNYNIAENRVDFYAIASIRLIHCMKEALKVLIKGLPLLRQFNNKQNKNGQA